MVMNCDWTIVAERLRVRFTGRITPDGPETELQVRELESEEWIHEAYGVLHKSEYGHCFETDTVIHRPRYIRLMLGDALAKILTQSEETSLR